MINVFVVVVVDHFLHSNCRKDIIYNESLNLRSKENLNLCEIESVSRKQIFFEKKKGFKTIKVYCKIHDSRRLSLETNLLASLSFSLSNALRKGKSINDAFWAKERED